MDHEGISLPTIAKQGETMMMPASNSGTLFLLGVRVDNITGETAMKFIHNCVANRRERLAGKVFFTNVHTIHLARKEASFKQIVNGGDIVLADGSGLKLAGRLLNEPILENLNGTDFVPAVLRRGEIHRWSVYLLGGRPDVIQKCRERLREMFPALRIVGSHHGHFSSEDEEVIIREINAAKPDIVLVALGSPLQEQWISRNTDRLHAGVCFGVGGLFDFISGQRKRAPSWLRSLGLEWVYRFLQDPQAKWNRVFVEIPVFVAILLAKWLFPKRFHEAMIRNGQAR